MRRVVPLIVAALALTLAAPAGAAKGPTLKSLQAQITVLNKKVKKLQAAQKVDRNLAVAGIVYTGCTLAVTADALQGTWMTIDGYVTGAGHAVEERRAAERRRDAGRARLLFQVTLSPHTGGVGFAGASV